MDSNLSVVPGKSMMFCDSKYNTGIKPFCFANSSISGIGDSRCFLDANHVSSSITQKSPSLWSYIRYLSVATKSWYVSYSILCASQYFVTLFDNSVAEATGVSKSRSLNTGKSVSAKFGVSVMSGKESDISKSDGIGNESFDCSGAMVFCGGGGILLNVDVVPAKGTLCFARIYGMYNSRGISDGNSGSVGS